MTPSETPPAKALSDRPEAEDHLGISPYAERLADFIQNCTTPLTLAIQGDWGSGKTNTMLLIEQALKPTARLSEVRSLDERAELTAQLAKTTSAPVFTITFNTWQYSQFNLDGHLAILMLQALVSELEKTVPPLDAKEKWVRGLAASAKHARLLTNALANIASNVTLGVSVGEVIPSAEAVDSGRVSAVELLATLRESLAALVATAVTSRSGAGAPGRIVVFIDDLDRLEPRRAVELMETLKLFLDLEHCVFVLAIDFDVVAQGVSEKYGSDEIDARKARSFFDKIIQVPFHMPVANYRTEVLLDVSCQRVGIELTDSERTHFIELFRSSVGSNPRSIKRLVNTLMLVRGIVGDGTRVDRLFAVLCLQLAHPHVFEDLPTEAFGEELGAVFSEDGNIDVLIEAVREKVGTNTEAEKKLLRRWGLENVPERRTMQHFAGRVHAVFQNEDGEFDTKAFHDALTQSAITGTRSDSADDSSDIRKWGHKFYLPDERSAEWDDRFAAEPRLRATYDLAERLVEGLAAIDLPDGIALRVGMQAGNNRHWTIECQGRRIGLLEVHQKFMHVYFGPRAWMQWHGEPVSDDRSGRNDFCKRSIRSAAEVDDIVARWAELLTHRLDVTATFAAG